ncbi:MAG: hypothetical protein A2655_02115 [Candidatus Yanofskybacteria bacterium RIFCSPHIGHO2_01_FULL_43_42]|nr:MAG: hypothetical protein A2655_02115 [Candidatus Yanofskybacteria bacterium RIFCSPHIGHO2_01_FULL_43_42]OGN13264.1 MAG: hypothetical protein A3D48_03020 [Candidatus Yanofskybacteria bacterium RIFCSPHIGHO2_02_FULL_43_17]
MTAVFVVFSFVFLASGVYAASTIGTNMSTTGTFTQTVGSATAAQFQNAAGDVNTLTVDTTNNRVGVNTATPQTSFEVQGTASASYFLTGNTIQVGGFASVAYNRFGTTATTHGHYIASSNDVFISGDLEVRATVSFAGVASMSQAFWIGTNGKTGNVGVGTNAPTTKFEVSGSASVSTDFEVGGVASAATFVAKTNVLANSGRTASSSTTYVAEFGTLDTGTVSLLFGGNSSSTGTCFQLKSTDGTWIYMRFFTGATTPTLSTTECN